MKMANMVYKSLKAIDAGWYSKCGKVCFEKNSFGWFWKCLDPQLYEQTKILQQGNFRTLQNAIDYVCAMLPGYFDLSNRVRYKKPVYACYPYNFKLLKDQKGWRVFNSQYGFLMDKQNASPQIMVFKSRKAAIGHLIDTNSHFLSF